MPAVYIFDSPQSGAQLGANLEAHQANGTTKTLLIALCNKLNTVLPTWNWHRTRAYTFRTLCRLSKLCARLVYLHLISEQTVCQKV